MPRVTGWLQALAVCLCGGIAGAHPLGPLTADEIIGAANLLLVGGAAQPGAIFQSVELREPPRAAVLGGSASDRQATVFWRQNKQSFRTLDEEVLASEAQGALEHEHAVWRVVNPNRRNALGQPTAYEVESHDYEEPLLAPADNRRATFIGHPLWVTAHDPDERYAAGDTPNQNPGSPGLPTFLADHQGLVNRDLVLWLTLGHHHVTQAEDWLVMSMKKMSFELRPANFFDCNPALGLRRAPFEAVAPGR